MSGDLARKILVAPDVFYAALLMKTNQIYFGKGDFKRILEILKNEKSDSFKDIARKLAMLKDGYLYQSGIQVDLNLEEGMKTIDPSQIPESDKLCVFSDKNHTYIKQPINYKVVFQVWAKQVCSHLNPGLYHGELEEEKFEYIDVKGMRKRERRKAHK